MVADPGKRFAVQRFDSPRRQGPQSRQFITGLSATNCPSRRSDPFGSATTAQASCPSVTGLRSWNPALAKWE